MKRAFSVNDSYVTAEEFANVIADLIHRGYQLVPPTTEKPVYKWAEE